MGCCNRNPKKITLPAVKTPSLEHDNSIIFPEGVKMVELEGYEVDPDNDRRLIPTEPICLQRMTGVMLKRDGTFKPHHICMHDRCEYKSLPVSFSICRTCPLRVSE